jgi:hypothetical protein
LVPHVTQPGLLCWLPDGVNWCATGLEIFSGTAPSALLLLLLAVHG